MISRYTIAAATLALATIATPAFAQTGDLPGWVLPVKKRFADNEQKALAEEFIGVRTEAGIETDLYTIEATGVSTDPIIQAAEGFLDTLTPAQRIRTQFAVEADEWRKWSNVDNGIYVRQGTSLKEMDEAQRAAAMALLRQSLSAKGLNLSLDIMKTDQSLAELNDDIFFLDEELYYFTIMGIPSAEEPWGWQLDGHHLVINYFVLGDQVVMTPTFMGAEPAISRSGKYEGNAVLQDEQAAGLAMMAALSPDQQVSAIIAERKSGNDIQAEANQDNLVLDYAGIPAARFTADQKAQLLDLVGLFVGNMREGHAAVKMEEVEKHLDETWFAWVGEVSDDAVFYYRIHSPVVLIEFDHQQPVGTSSINERGVPTRDHIHTVIRTPNGNDYGKDLLGQHLAEHSHD